MSKSVMIKFTNLSKVLSSDVNLFRHLQTNDLYDKYDTGNSSNLIPNRKPPLGKKE